MDHCAERLQVREAEHEPFASFGKTVTTAVSGARHLLERANDFDVVPLRSGTSENTVREDFSF
jgi:hypothetical protein